MIADASWPSLVLIAILMVPSLAQEPAAKSDPFGPLRFFVDARSGEQHGQPGRGTSERTYVFVLNNRFLQEKNTSTYLPQEKNQNGEVHQFVYYAKPFKSLFKLTRPDGTEIIARFDGKVSWTITPQRASIDKDTPFGAIRRDKDLQYALHQPDYFQRLELAGVTDFEGHRCYWLHGTTNWGKDNNQFYGIDTGLLIGYRFESDDASKTITIALFQDYKSFGGPLMATKNVSRTGDRSQTFTYNSVSYEPLADSVFELPEAVKCLMK